MMRCIQNALDSGYITPDEARALNARVSGLLREGLAPPEVKQRMVERMTFEAQEAERVALLMEERRQVLESFVLNHKNARGENDPAEALWMLIERHHAANFVSIAEKEAVIMRIVYAEGETMFHEFRKRFWIGDTKGLRKRHAGRLRNVLHEVMEAKQSRDGDRVYLAASNKSGDPTARAYADAWMKIADYLRRRFNAAGGHVGKIDYGYMPTGHDRAAIANAGGDPTRARSYWVDYMMQDGVLNRDRMVSAVTGLRLTDDELREALDVVWQRIVTDGWIDADPTYAPIGRGALSNRHAADRFLHFKDADAWIAYHKEFGKGDVYDAMTGHIRRMVRDIAVLEVLGPNPEAMRNYLKKLVNQAAANARPAATIIGEETQRLRDLLDTVSPATSDNRRVIEETRAVLNNLSELQRRLGAGGSRKRHLEHQMANQVDRLAGLRDELNNLRAAGMDQREADLVIRLQEADGKIAQLRSSPAKGKRGQRRRQAELQRLTKDADRLRSELDDLRVGYRDVAARAADLEQRLAEKRGELDARQRLEAGFDRRADQGIWPMPGDPPPPDRATTQRLRAEVNQLEIELGKVRPTVQDARPRVHEEMVAIIERMKNDMDGMAASGSRDLEPVEALLEDFSRRLRRIEIEGAGQQLDAIRGVKQAEHAMGQVDDPLESPAAFFASLVQSVRQRRIASDPELRADLEARLQEAIDKHGAVLDAIGVDMNDLHNALAMTRAARPLFEVPAAFRSVKDPMDAAKRGIGRHDAMWEVLRGNAEVVEGKTLANVGKTVRNTLTASLLGSANIAALGDVVLQRRVRRLMGLPKNTLSLMAGTLNAMRGVNRREATRAMLMLDSALHIEHQRSRFTDDFDASSWSGYFADRVINISGLASWTQGGKHFFGMSVQGELADRVHLRFDELHPDLQKTFRDSGLNSADWDVIRRARLHEPHDGVTFLRPNEVMAMPDGQELGERYLAMMLRMTAQAVPEGSIRSRAWFTSGRPGTVGGELLRSFAHFKTFPVMMKILHLGAISREFQAGNVSRGMSQATSLFVTTAIAGAVINELLEMSNGKQPILPTLLANGQVPGFMYWFAAVMKGGGLGIYGDLALGGLERSGGFAATMGGPAIGFIDAARSGTAGQFSSKKPNPGRTAVRVVKRAVPGQNLWFSKLLTDRFIFDQIQNTFDPDYPSFVRRKTTMQRANHGNEYWWKPGDTAPSHAPWDLDLSPRTRQRLSADAERREKNKVFRDLKKIMSTDDARLLLQQIEDRGLTRP